MTLDAFKKKYRLILTDEMLKDLEYMVKFIQSEAFETFYQREIKFPRGEGG
jgi:predicted component of type VI protein secretion system